MVVHKQKEHSDFAIYPLCGNNKKLNPGCCDSKWKNVTCKNCLKRGRDKMLTNESMLKFIRFCEDCPTCKKEKQKIEEEQKC